ncbi:hypothetical protein LDENG_00114330 [Lucifuga dentata]|nr:hypothetical protein LDENG_00114330 [Lucifuga dentata]
MTVSTLLDPWFKTFGFVSQNNSQTAVRRLAAECAAVIRREEHDPMTAADATIQAGPADSTSMATI